MDFPEIFRAFRFWTFLKMSIFQKLTNFLEKSHAKMPCDHYALISVFS